MKRYIIGSGGFAKEVFFLLKEVYRDRINFHGFIDITNNGILDIGDSQLAVINENSFDSEVGSNTSDIELYLGLSTPELMKKIVDRFKRFRFPNLVHSSFCGNLDSIKFGKGNIITPGCIFTVDINIGSFNIFNTNTCVGHDSVIGSYNVFLPRTQVSGCVKIGDLNIFGMSSSILQGKKVGNNNSFGAYSFIIRNVQDDASYFGIPAQKINF